jgi:DNA replication initiation complex subunit (GINS family)
MSEENPVFKVTDRRLFNSDGSPREIEEASKPETKNEEPAPPAQAPATADATPTPEKDNAAPIEQEAPTKQTEKVEAAPPNADSDSTESLPDDDQVHGDIPGVDDPTSFINFLMSIASNAAAALGMMEHPATGERSLEPELGKHWIDVLGMLQKKTQGNLSPQEKQIFEGLLADLRMQYVSLGNAPQSKSSRFSGSDIVGGK